MERLSGIDTAFLHLESTTMPLHVGVAAIFEGAPRGGGPAVDRMRALVGSRLHLMPPLRRKLAPTMGGLRPLMWMDDDDVALEEHVFAGPALAELTRETVATVASDVMRHRLDRTKPLWEMYVLEGRNDLRVAVVAKVHHAAIDGLSGISLLANLVDLAPDAPAVAAPPTRAVPRSARPPGLAAALWARFGAMARDSAGDLRNLGDMLERRQAQRTTAHADDEVAERGQRLMSTAPRTSLTRPITSRRAVRFTSLSMDDLRQVKKSLGGTFNDVVLAVCGGAVRDYLLDRDDVLDGALVAGVPVSLRTGDDEPAAGNLLSAMLVNLATDIDDPRERYAAIAANTVAAKRHERHTRPGELTSDALSLIRPLVGRQIGRLAARLSATGRLALPCNVLVSNIPGPPFRMYADGMAMAAAYPLGPIIDAVPLNITVLSYCDELQIGLLACPRIVPDLDELGIRLQASLDELVACAG